MKSKVLLQSALALAIATPLAAMAESSVVNNAVSGNSATADLNISVTIPQFLSLTVGSAGSTVDTVEFVLDEAQAVTAGPVAATANGTVAVALRSNAGAVNFSSSGADLAAAVGASTIPLSAISVDASGGALPHPGFNAAATTVNPVNGVIDQTGSWVFAYNHSTTQVPGTYATTVTYTAALP